MSHHKTSFNRRKQRAAHHLVALLIIIGASYLYPGWIDLAFFGLHLVVEKMHR